MIATGVLLALLLMTRQARRTDWLSPDQVMDMVFVVVASGFLGARLFYTAQYWEYYRAEPLRVFAFWEGGLIFYGGLILGVIGLILYAKLKNYSVLKVFDFLVPYVALVQGFGRLGCFLNGCCGGKECHLPWAVHFPGHEQATHPTQLYEAFFDFALFAYLWNLSRRAGVTGKQTALYFIGYAVTRFCIELWREGNPFLGLFTVNQWISIGFASAGLGLYLYAKRTVMGRRVA